MIELIGISKKYINNGYEKEVIKDLNLQFGMTEFVAILGESGSGKSTLLNILGGLDFDFDGSYIIENQDSKDIDFTSLRKQRIGFIFQEINLISHLSALENVELALTLNGMPKEERRNVATDMLKKVGLENQVDKKPGYLSGGEKQRVAIARSLVNNPDIILADEPTGQLDTETSVEILDLLKDLCKDKLVIMVTHMEEFAYRYATRVIKIDDGEIFSDEQIDNTLLNVNRPPRVENCKNILVKDTLFLATKNILSFKRLTVLLLMVLTLGMSTFILVTGIGLSLREHSNKIIKVNNDINLFNITIYGYNLSAPLYLDYEDEFKKIDNLKEIYFTTHLFPVLDFNENIEIKDQMIYGLDSELEFVIYTCKEQSFFANHILVGNYPKNKNEILIGRKTAINLIYDYYEMNGIQKPINNLSNDEILNIVKNYNITYFTTHKNVSENRYQFKNYYVQPLSNYFLIVGIVDDDNIPIFSIYRNEIDYYEPRVFVQEDAFYEIINQYNDNPLETNIMEYYTPHHLLIETKNYDDYQIRLKAIKEILSFSTDFHYYDDYIDELYNNIRSFSLFLMAVGVIFGSIVFIVTSIIVGGLIYRNMENRKLEFGVLFSLGFNKTQIKKILLLESIIISVLGLVTSYIISLLINFIIRDDLSSLMFKILDQDDYINIRLISVKWYIIIFVFVLISYTFIRPIKKLSRINIIDVLRKE